MPTTIGRLSSIGAACALLAGLIAGPTGPANADDLFAPVDYIDFADRSGLASDTGRHLLVLYVGDDCAACERLIGEVAASPQLQGYLAKHFDTARINLSGTYSVSCPQGIDLDQEEFAEMKGIDKLPTLVVHDGNGNLSVRLEDVASTAQLALFSRYVAEGHFRTNRDFARWSAQHGQRTTALEAK